jgi:hypothetical protein
MAGFAERAKRELLASGETSRARCSGSPPASRRDQRDADCSGGPGRAAGPGRPVQPGDRRPPVHQLPHRSVPPGQGVHQARHQLPRPTPARYVRQLGQPPAALALAGWPVSRRTAGSPLASCLYIWRIRVPHLPDDNRRDAAANEHDAKERHRDHLAEHIFSHAVPGHRRADGPVRPKRAPRRSRPAAQPVVREPARFRGRSWTCLLLAAWRAPLRTPR